MNPPIQPDASTPGPPPRNPPPNPWAKATMWMVIVALLLAGALYVFRSLRELPGNVIDKAGAVIEKAGARLMDLASAFSSNVVTTSFLSYAANIQTGHHLQFATIRQMEIFSQKDQARTGFGYIPLPDVIVEARAPVEYNYYVDLNAKWEFILKDNTVYVLAPEIEYNKPSVDASEIQYEVRKGSIFRRTEQVKENLKKSITDLADRRAKENAALVRDTARKQVGDFVERWLEKSFTDGKKYPVKVFFPDEAWPEGVPMIKKPLG